MSIRFTDTGPGIPADQKIFQPLQKGADATGLGLYLSRAFMRSFRGDLRHDPRHPGCSFVLELVCTDRVYTGRRCNAYESYCLTIMCCFVKACAACSSPSRISRSVAECGTPAEAVELLSRTAVDVVLLDFDLGDETGTGFIARANQAGYKGKILMVTAGMIPLDVTMARNLGVSGIFLKHNSPAMLLQAIRHVALGGEWMDSRAVSSDSAANDQSGSASDGTIDPPRTPGSAQRFRRPHQQGDRSQDRRVAELRKGNPAALVRENRCADPRAARSHCYRTVPGNGDANRDALRPPAHLTPYLHSSPVIGRESALHRCPVIPWLDQGVSVLVPPCRWP